MTRWSSKKASRWWLTTRPSWHSSALRWISWRISSVASSCSTIPMKKASAGVERASIFDRAVFCLGISWGVYRKILNLLKENIKGRTDGGFDEWTLGFACKDSYLTVSSFCLINRIIAFFSYLFVTSRHDKFFSISSKYSHNYLYIHPSNAILLWNSLYNKVFFFESIIENDSQFKRGPPLQKER